MGADSDLEKAMQVLRPFQNGSSFGISMGKHFLVSKESEIYESALFRRTYFAVQIEFLTLSLIWSLNVHLDQSVLL